MAAEYLQVKTEMAELRQYKVLHPLLNITLKYTSRGTAPSPEHQH